MWQWLSRRRNRERSRASNYLFCFFKKHEAEANIIIPWFLKSGWIAMGICYTWNISLKHLFKNFLFLCVLYQLQIKLKVIIRWDDLKQLKKLENMLPKSPFKRPNHGQLSTLCIQSAIFSLLVCPFLKVCF